MVGGSCAGGATVSDGERPNILVIWGDDIGITNLSCYSDGLMGYRDAQHRPDRGRGDAVHGLLR
jgi:arylsulfatase A-like enzyme